MSYESRANLAADAAFKARTITCCKEQALVFKDDGRADIAAFADAVILNAGNAAPLVELVAVAPNFVDVTNSASIPDADILAAVQAQWPTYAAIAYPAPPPAE